MPNTILLKRSSTANATPSAANLTAGELAINTADGKLFTKKGDGTVVAIGGLSQTDANALYQPKLANTTYSSRTPIPLIRNAPYYQGELYANIPNTASANGRLKTILDGATEHPQLPNVPYGYIAGEYYSDAALNQLDSYRIVSTDPQEIGLYVKGSGIQYNSAVSVRSNLVTMTAGVDTAQATISMDASSGATYSPPAGVPIASSSLLNKSQLDSLYVAYSRFGRMDLVANSSNQVQWVADPFKIAVLFLNAGTMLYFPTGPGLIPGATYNLVVVQNALNTPCDIVWQASQTNSGNYLFPNKTKPALSTVKGCIDVFSFIYDGLNMYGAIQRNFGVGQ